MPVFGCRLGPRASFRYPPFTSPMFTVHLADVHSAPCIVYNSPYTMSREYTSSRLYLLLTVQHTQLLGHLTFFYIDEASPGGISVNGYYYEIIFQPVFCKDHCYLVLKALTLRGTKELYKLPDKRSVHFVHRSRFGVIDLL